MWRIVIIALALIVQSAFSQVESFVLDFEECADYVVPDMPGISNWDAASCFDGHIPNSLGSFDGGLVIDNVDGDICIALDYHFVIHCTLPASVGHIAPITNRHIP